MGAHCLPQRPKYVLTQPIALYLTPAVILIYSGNPQTSQSVPLWLFSNVQCGQILMLPASPDGPPPIRAASSAAIWSNTSGGMSSSIVVDIPGAEVDGLAAICLSAMPRS